MALVKKAQVGGDSGITVSVEIIQDATDFRMDDADGAFRATPATPRISCPEHLIANGFSEDIAGWYDLRESRTAWTNGIYTLLFRKNGLDDVSQVDRILVINDVAVLLWQSPT